MTANEPEPHLQALRPRQKMRLRQIWALDGPNAWIDRPVIRVVLDTGNPSGASRDRLDQLLAGFAADPDAQTSGPAAPVANVGALLATVIMDLQQLAGDQVTFNLSTALARDDRYDVVCECHETDLAETAARVAVRFLSHLVYQIEPAFDLNREFERHVMWYIRYRNSQREQQATIAAARRRDIPFRFVDKRQRLLEFGLGAYAERFLAVMSSKSVEVASRIARDKPLAKELMHELGVPVPDGAVVCSAGEAITVAEQLGYPLVVKPSDLKHGTGVTVGIRSPEELAIAVDAAVAASTSGQALVETMITGRDFRITVIGDRVTRVVERVPAHVIGDGQKTVAELIALVNEEPRRQPGRTNLYPIPVDEATVEALAFVDMTLQSIPEPGQHVAVKLVANLHQGGTTDFRTDDIHPDNATVARLAAKAVGLEVCGLDFMIPDISESVWEVGGAVIEVNSEPQNRATRRPEEKWPTEIGIAIMDMFFPPGRSYQPTIIAVATGARESSPSRLLQRIVRQAGYTAGVATHSSMEIDGPDVAVHVATDRAEIGKVCHNQYVTCAILEVDQQATEESGLPFLHCDVAVACSSEGRISASGARPVCEVLAGRVRPGGAIVHGLDDLAILLPNCADVNRRHFLVCTDPEHLAIARHLQHGGSVVTITRDAILYRTQRTDVPVLSLDRLGASARTAETLSLLQAVAASLAIDVPVSVIRAALGDSCDPQETGVARVL